MKGINVKFVMLERIKQPVRTDAGNVIHPWLVADESGSIDLTLYDAHGDSFNAGDIVCLFKGYCHTHRNSLKLGVGPAGKPRRIGEFTMRYVEQPYMSAPFLPVGAQQRAQQHRRPPEQVSAAPVRSSHFTHSQMINQTPEQQVQSNPKRPRPASESYI
ncbi:MAG: hypothetical protein SGPRY_013451 [Prymnesium sp.]